MGKILIVNTGPTRQEQYGACPVDAVAVLDETPAEWARAAAERSADYEIKAVYSCPVPGAGGMAQVIAACFSLAPEELPGLAGERPVSWTGVDPGDALLMDCSFAEVPAGVRVKLPFANSLGDLREKVAAALDSIAVKHKKEAIVVVSHRALTVIMVLHMLHMHNSHYRQVAQDYGAVNLFEVRFGIPSAIYINDTCHLHGLT